MCLPGYILQMKSHVHTSNYTNCLKTKMFKITKIAIVSTITKSICIHITQLYFYINLYMRYTTYFLVLGNFWFYKKTVHSLELIPCFGR